MVSTISVKVLSISDLVIESLYSQKENQPREDIDLILACGDIPYYYIDEVQKAFGVPVYYIRGNHDKLIEYGSKGERSKPTRAVDLHNKVVFHGNLLMAGLEGSLRYKHGPFMYTQPEMWRNVFSLIPKLLLNKITHGRYLDVLISHAPPWDIHDRPTNVHRGFKAITWLLKTFKPSYHFHGHIHNDHEENPTTESIFYNTKVINTVGYKFNKLYPGKRHYSVEQAGPGKLSKFDSPSEDFRNARRRAALETVFDTFSGKSSELMSFHQVKDLLGTKSYKPKGLQKIPLDAIVGSVGRYEDFTRKFLPRPDIDETRWIKIKKMYGSIHAMPPIDTYKIGEVYFVLDGNHRVSVARQMNADYINSYVTEIETAVPLSPDDQPDDIIIKAGLAKFLKDTNLGTLRPDIDFGVTAPGRYRQLRDHISTHHYLMELRQNREVAYEKAVADWVDTVYLPTIHIIRQQGLLRDFPGRTPTDIYLWFVEHQLELTQELGWHIQPDRVGEDLVAKYSSRPSRLFARIKEKILEKSRIKLFDSGPPTGEWRKVLEIPRQEDNLISSSLTAISGQPYSWVALEQALLVATREGGVVRGAKIDTSKKNGTNNEEIQTEFLRRCEEKQVQGEFIVEKGEIALTLTHLSRWNDLLVIGLAHPPADNPIGRLQSGLRTLIQISPRPLLLVPAYSPMTRALLAYDCSPKANEALFLSAYMAKNWGIALNVVSVNQERIVGARHDSPASMDVLENAKQYLDHREIQAEYFQTTGNPGKEIIKVAQAQDCDFIVMGGYGLKPILEVLRGSTVDTILRDYNNPVLLCK